MIKCVRDDAETQEFHYGMDCPKVNAVVAKPGGGLFTSFVIFVVGMIIMVGITAVALFLQIHTVQDGPQNFDSHLIHLLLRMADQISRRFTRADYQNEMADQASDNKAVANPR